MPFLRFFLLDLIEERSGLCREGGWVGVVVVEGGMPVPWSVFSTGASLPCAETGTLWEPAGSGSLYVQGAEGELRKQSAKKHNLLS